MIDAVHQFTFNSLNKTALAADKYLKEITALLYFYIVSGYNISGRLNVKMLKFRISLY